jgi:hypothetical protein
MGIGITVNDLFFWAVVVLIPLVFIGLTSLIRCLTANDREWEHFYLGVDVTFAAVTGAILNVFEAARHIHETVGETDNPFVEFSKASGNGIAIVIPFIFLFVNMFLEQDYINKKKPQVSMSKEEKGKLHRVQMFVSNGLGILAFFLTAYFLRY